MPKPWEKYQEAPVSSSKARGPWDRYRGSGSPSDAFQKAVQRVLEHEGGWADDPDDRGGATNFGISSKAHPDVDVKSLTKERAIELYRERYWEPLNADSLPEGLRELAFDAAVQHGVSWAKNALEETKGNVKAFLDKRKRFYEGIVKRDPSQEKFLNGWMNRLESYRPKMPWLNYGGSE